MPAAVQFACNTQLQPVCAGALLMNSYSSLPTTTTLPGRGVRLQTPGGRGCDTGCATAHHLLACQHADHVVAHASRLLTHAGLERLRGPRNICTGINWVWSAACVLARAAMVHAVEVLWGSAVGRAVLRCAVHTFCNCCCSSLLRAGDVRLKCALHMLMKPITSSD